MCPAPYSRPLEAAGTALPIFGADDLRSRVGTQELIQPVIDAFAAFSRGEGESDLVTFAPGGPTGDVHVKTAWLPDHRYFTVKVATWFAARTGLRGSATDGYIVVHDARTGDPIALLQDEHHLTDVRTAAAGAMAVSMLAPHGAHSIGVLGTGTQAHLQAVAAVAATQASSIVVWGRRGAEAARMSAAIAAELPGISVDIAESAQAAVAGADVVISATASHQPIVCGEWLAPGQLIVSVGADDPTKLELDADCFRRADLVVVDSRRDAPRQAGDLRSAIEQGAVERADLTEIGEIVLGRRAGRRDDDHVVVVKLIGLGVQDLAAATVALQRLLPAMSEGVE